MYIKNQTILVLGVSKSGYSVAKYVLNNHGKCYLFEENDSEKVVNALNELTSQGGIFVKGDDVENILSDVDVVVISPGVPINHSVAVRAKQLGIRIIGELEFGYLTLQPTTVAVTGTNGKTTTVKLIENILSKTQMSFQTVGNVGTPLTSVVDQVSKNDVLVCEVSSFQLESISSFCPHISCVLNIAPDHLERHYSMENYIFLKKRIMQNQKSSEYAVLNYDDETVKTFASDCNANIVWVSSKQVVEGAYKSGESLYYFNEKIIDVNELPVAGVHNEYNTLFAIAVCKLLGVSDEEIYSGIKSFHGVPNRIELIAEKGGIKYYNDSKATNTASTVSALDTMTAPTVLILGGSEKGESYDALFEKVKESYVIHTVLTGDARFNLLKSAEKIGINEITVVKGFEDAVKVAKKLCVEGGNVLLSPACASFDNFRNYEERGDEFKRIVDLL